MAARENEVWRKIVCGLGQSKATIEAAKGLVHSWYLRNLLVLPRKSFELVLATQAEHAINQLSSDAHVNRKQSPIRTVWEDLAT